MPKYHAPDQHSTERLLRSLRKEKVMSFSELIPLCGSRMGVSRRAKKGIIQALGGGLYASVELDPFVASLIATAKYYPNAIISGRTALLIHELSQDFIEKIDVDILNRHSIRNRFLKVHRLTKSKMIGVTELVYHGIRLRIYDRERSLVEAYKIDPAGGYFYKALKRYILSGKVKTEMIKNYDAVMRTKVLQHLQQELADG